MKTTVEIDDELLKAAKKAAIDEGVSLRAFMENALRARLASPVPPAIYAGFETRGALYEEGTFQILEDLEAAASEYQQHLREKAS
jgi:hypothetical protein